MKLPEIFIEYACFFVLVGIFIVFLILIIRKHLIGGYLGANYIIKEDDNIYIYMAIGYDISSITKVGFQFMTTHKFKKFNLLKKKFEFEVFVPISGDNAHFLGLSKKLAYGKASARKLFTVCLKTGKIKYYTKRKIKKHNPNLADFSMRSFNYCENAKLFIFEDNMSYSWWEKIFYNNEIQNFSYR